MEILPKEATVVFREDEEVPWAQAPTPTAFQALQQRLLALERLFSSPSALAWQPPFSSASALASALASASWCPNPMHHQCQAPAASAPCQAPAASPPCPRFQWSQNPSSPCQAPAASAPCQPPEQPYPWGQKVVPSCAARRPQPGAHPGSLPRRPLPLHLPLPLLPPLPTPPLPLHFLLAPRHQRLRLLCQREATVTCQDLFLRWAPT
mmetsp:Transcript_44481/g.100481  ORF Transcript_44481/g.100481 Transcript_44481/m.100481 type:complete len:208 (-) Transcript_44481:5983-6606(-)